ncbi:3-phenylpropionate MFS transporter [[Haemophilus] felis]|uniref:3-phenylpropionic acid transporter n=1 Tax=[Haemophilus] felis TaxID=123822 RepID=A0A1T0B6I6_9PAST|nr:3-phenylpropionate MFS transporter [[Haemophilus] felis]NBI40835.1 3-phenylpropionate MFS transporter [[Haemophilus] felis]OOS05539.1 3-phenylpropionic acid transporter [[Haemophilus] felis]
MKISAFQWLSLNFFGYFCAYGVFMPFFPVWLKSQAYGEELIGLIIASSYVFRFFGGIFFSALVKQAAQLIYGLRYVGWFSCLIILSMGFMAENFWLLFIAIGLFALINAAGMPLSDTLASIWQQQINLDYGKARLIGSFAFIVGVVVFGYIIGATDESYIIWIIGGLFLFYAVTLMSTPNPMPENAESSTENKITFKKLLQNKTTLRLLIAISLIQGSHAAYYTYSVLYWTSSGISVQVTSLLWGLSVVAEMALFFFSSKLFRTWKVSSLFYLSALGCVIRWLALSVLDNDVLFIALTQCLHCLTYAVSHYAIIRYFTTQPQSHIAKLQGLYNGISGCAVVALLTALSGVIYLISPAITFLLMAAFALCALIVTPRKVDAFLLRRH